MADRAIANIEATRECRSRSRIIRDEVASGSRTRDREFCIYHQSISRRRPAIDARRVNLKRSEHINELATSLAKAQAAMQDASKTSTNPFFHSKYADLASVWEACRKPLSANGLSVVQTIEINAGPFVKGRILESTLMHTSGQWLSSEIDLLPKEETEQALGSAITYSRRYALAALVGICPDDDDGEAAMVRAKPSESSTKQPSSSKTEGYFTNIGEVLTAASKLTPPLSRQQVFDIGKIIDPSKFTDFDGLWKQLQMGK